MPYLKTLRKTADEPFMPGLPEEEEVVPVADDADLPVVATPDAPAVPTAEEVTQDYVKPQQEVEA